MNDTEALKIASLRYARSISSCPRELILPKPLCKLESCPTSPFTECWIEFFRQKAREAITNEV